MNKQYRPRLSREELELILEHREKTNTTRGDHLYQKKMILPDTKPRILLFDIETAPMQAYVWGRYKQFLNSEQVIREGFMLCYAAKWLGDDNIMVDALPFYPEFSDGSEENAVNDKMISESLWDLLNEADIVIAHNAKRFDVKVANTRFLYHNLKPYAPFKIIDTLMMVKGLCKFTSNRLDDLGEYLDVGRKVKHEGFELWTKCMDGNDEAWEKMVEYNIGDIILLEKIYMKLRGWDKKHPSVSLLYEDDKKRCTVCGSENIEEENFLFHTAVSSFESYRCNDCGHWNRGRKNIRSKKQMDNTVRNVM